MADKIKVLIADDIMILRQGLKAVLSSDSSIEVVALASNGKEAYEKCRVYEPDVVLMDMRMPNYDGAFGISAIKQNCPDIKILVLTTFDDEPTIQKALISGADGYILKELEDEKIIASIHSVHSGINVFGEGVYKVMREQLSAPASPVNKQADTNMFTEKELEILKLVANGYDNKEIAKEIYLAEGTVRNNISKLLEKLELKDRTQLAVYAVKHGLD